MAEAEAILILRLDDQSINKYTEKAFKKMGLER